VNATRFKDLFDEYPGGTEAFIHDFNKFLIDPRRFTYTPLIMCKGKKPLDVDSSKVTSLSGPIL
jgi:hypothetical protein